MMVVIAFTNRKLPRPVALQPLATWSGTFRRMSVNNAPATADHPGRREPMDDHHADELLRRALIEPEASAAVALRVGDLPVCESLTVVFHGRRDIGTIQTYVARGRHGAGDALQPGDLMRVPCDLDLGDAEDRED